MELREFIKETLLQITQGITEAQQETDGTSAVINPRQLERSTQEKTAIINNNKYPVHVRYKDRLMNHIKKEWRRELFFMNNFQNGITSSNNLNLYQVIF